MRMENGTVAVEDSLAIPQKIKHTIIILCSNSTPGYQPKEMKAGPQRGI